MNVRHNVEHVSTPFDIAASVPCSHIVDTQRMKPIVCHVSCIALNCDAFLAECCTAIYPVMTGPPDFIYNTRTVTYRGLNYLDFYFTCRVYYATQTAVTGDDGSRFDVTLLANGLQVSQLKTTDSFNLDVVFTSQEHIGLFDQTVIIMLQIINLHCNNVDVQHV